MMRVVTLHSIIISSHTWGSRWRSLKGFVLYQQVSRLESKALLLCTINTDSPMASVQAHRYDGNEDTSLRLHQGLICPLFVPNNPSISYVSSSTSSHSQIIGFLFSSPYYKLDILVAQMVYCKVSMICIFVYHQIVLYTHEFLHDLLAKCR